VILVLTAGFGDGHNTAAHSVAEALQMQLESTPEPVLVVDLFAEHLPRLTRVLQAAYQAAIVNFPGAWKWAYQQLARSDIGRQPNALNATLQTALAGLLKTYQPRALVSTYPFYSTLLAPIRRTDPVPPLFTIVTDSVSVHPSWTNDPSDYFCVADQDTAHVLHDRQLPADRVIVTGFPVSPAFAAPPAPAPPANPRPAILYLPSTPVRHVAATLEALRPLLLSGAHLTLPVGKHKRRLHLILNRFADSLPADRFTLIGWTDQMPNLLRTHDLVICKAGGAILHEVLAARIPAIIDYVVPGQEEGNADMLLKHQCALRSHSPRETGAAAVEMLASSGRLAEQMRARMIPPLSLPNAAHVTAAAILRHL
jgi:processive 1,2-diacylglycerol beta-glucosyltransferase